MESKISFETKFKDFKMCILEEVSGNLGRRRSGTLCDLLIIKKQQTRQLFYSFKHQYHLSSENNSMKKNLFK